jgi:hypothetical protein
MVLLGAAEMDRAIEAASQMGESRGQGIDPSVPPDLQAMAPKAKV